MTKEVYDEVKGVLALLLTGAEYTRQVLMSAGSVPGPASPTQLAQPDRRPNLPLGFIIGRFHARAVQEGEQVGKFVSQMLSQAEVRLGLRGTLQQQPVQLSFDPAGGRE